MGVINDDESNYEVVLELNDFFLALPGDYSDYETADEAAVMSNLVESSNRMAKSNDDDLIDIVIDIQNELPYQIESKNENLKEERKKHIL